MISINKGIVGFFLCPPFLVFRERSFQVRPIELEKRKYR
jgi:hypothetical protein